MVKKKNKKVATKTTIRFNKEVEKALNQIVKDGNFATNNAAINQAILHYLPNKEAMAKLRNEAVILENKLYDKQSRIEAFKNAFEAL